MIAADTNIFLYAFNADAPEQGAAWTFLEKHLDNPEFVLCELMLVELYVLLRSPAVLRRPLSPDEAVATVQQLRRHPTWQLIDHNPEVMQDVWKAAERRGFARGRIYDARLALTLSAWGHRVCDAQYRTFRGVLCVCSPFLYRLGWWDRQFALLSV